MYNGMGRGGAYDAYEGHSLNFYFIFLNSSQGFEPFLTFLLKNFYVTIGLQCFLFIFWPPKINA